MLTLLGCPGADTRDRHRPLQPSRDVASDASLQNFPYKTEVFKGRKVTRKDCERICQQDAKCVESRFDAALHSCALFGRSTDEPTPASARLHGARCLLRPPEVRLTARKPGEGEGQTAKAGLLTESGIEREEQCHHLELVRASVNPIAVEDVCAARIGLCGAPWDWWDGNGA